MLEHHAHEGMTTFVVSRQALFLIVHDVGLALRAGHNALNGFLEFLHVNLLLIPAGSQESCFVHEVAEVSTGKARGTACQDVEVCAFIHRLAGSMYFKDC